MATSSKYSLFKKSRLAVDLSPMIDLVFLLLIFFMISSKLVTIRQDSRVSVPFASAAAVPESTSDRLVINVYEDGTIGNESGEPLNLASVTQLVIATKSKNPNVRLHLRADRRAAHEKVKEVIDAAADGGLKQVIFSTES